ncbi:Uncharacterised protein [Mycobacteroides abscessus subsp. abscessus]|nr:Uncharacterised protein [Mycobacteroides abscessus subsp. abscessus]
MPGSSARAVICPARPESWPRSKSARHVSATFCRVVHCESEKWVCMLRSARSISSDLVS